MKILRNKDVLDFGCGWGGFLRNIKSYKSLIKDNTVDYQRFISHGPYHLVYFVIINTLQKYNLHDKIEYLDCSYNSFPCYGFYDTFRINEIFLRVHMPRKECSIHSNPFQRFRDK